MSQNKKINQVIILAISVVILLAFVWRVKNVYDNMKVTINESTRTSTIGIQVTEEETDKASSHDLTKKSPEESKGRPLTIERINEMNLEELVEIKGIGEVTAQKILDYIKENGPFESFDDLIQIKGIGEKKLEQIKKSQDHS